MARLAHELNAPLSVVVGSLSTLEHYVMALVRQSATGPLDDGSDAEDVVGKIMALLQLCRDGTRRLEHVTRQLRSFGGPAMARCGSVDLIPVLEQAIRLARPDTADRRRITFEASPGLPFVRGVGESLGQVFVNLLRNALEAVAQEPEPHVCVRARLIECEPRSASVERATPPRRWVEISVSDNGPGIPAEVRRKLFQPFVSTKGAGGMGLGLAIAHDVVTQHGGRITLRRGSGAHFVVRLPAEIVSPVARL